MLKYLFLSSFLFVFFFINQFIAGEGRVRIMQTNILTLLKQK